MSTLMDNKYIFQESENIYYYTQIKSALDLGYIDRYAPVRFIYWTYLIDVF